VHACSPAGKVFYGFPQLAGSVLSEKELGGPLAAEHAVGQRQQKAMGWRFDALRKSLEEDQRSLRLAIQERGCGRHEENIDRSRTGCHRLFGKRKESCRET